MGSSTFMFLLTRKTDKLFTHFKGKVFLHHLTTFLEKSQVIFYKTFLIPEKGFCFGVLYEKKYLSLLFVSILLIFLSTQIIAGSGSWTRTDADGTKYTMAANFEDVYKIDTLFELDLTLTADTFGTISGVIVAFYDIEIQVTISGDLYFAAQNTTLPDIDTEGGSSSTTLTFNLSDITDDNFYVTTQWTFKGNNVQGEDPDNYGGFWGLGRVRVKEANASIIVPILAVLSVAYITHKKQKK